MAKLFEELSDYLDSPSVLRRMLFAVVNLPKDLPDYWKIVRNFGTCGADDKLLTSTKVQALVDNLQYLDKDVFLSDKNLMELLMKEQGRDGKPIGIALISSHTQCQSCGGDLMVKADRPSHLTLYSDSFGTVTAVHYRKICKNTRRGLCNTVQYYGYCSKQTGALTYDVNWRELPYFISSRETAFEMSMLIKLDADILIGLMSYKQRADIYNYIHGYNIGAKSANEEEHR